MVARPRLQVYICTPINRVISINQRSLAEDSMVRFSFCFKQYRGRSQTPFLLVNLGNERAMWDRGQFCCYCVIQFYVQAILYSSHLCIYIFNLLHWILVLRACFIYQWHFISFRRVSLCFLRQSDQTFSEELVVNFLGTCSRGLSSTLHGQKCARNVMSIYTCKKDNDVTAMTIVITKISSDNDIKVVRTS